MRSYVSATLLKTPATRCVFSASVTVSKPKCVSRSAVLLVLAPVPVVVLLALVAEKRRDGNVVVGMERRVDRRRHGAADILRMLCGAAIMVVVVWRGGEG